MEAEFFTRSSTNKFNDCCYIKVRVIYFWLFEEDGSRRRWCSTVRSGATLKILVDVSFSSRVRNNFLSLVDCGWLVNYSSARSTLRYHGV